MKEDFNERLTDLSGLEERFDVFYKNTLRNAISDFIKKEIRRYGREELYGIRCPYEICGNNAIDAITGTYVYEVGCDRVIIKDERLKKLLDGLTKRRRDVFLLTAALEYSYSEAASILGISKETVKSAKTRALRDIRRMLAEDPL